MTFGADIVAIWTPHYETIHRFIAEAALEHLVEFVDAHHGSRYVPLFSSLWSSVSFPKKTKVALHASSVYTVRFKNNAPDGRRRRLARLAPNRMMALRGLRLKGIMGDLSEVIICMADLW